MQQLYKLFTIGFLFLFFSSVGYTSDDKTFAALGLYFKKGDSNSYPLLALSYDGDGTDWIYPKNFSAQLPKDFKTVSKEEPIRVSCILDTCCVIGHYDDVNHSGHSFIATSIDRGNNWSYLTAPIESVKYTNASCTESFCAIAGMYSSKKDPRALIATTSNKKIDWQYPKIFDLPQNVSTQVNDFMCSETSCLAVGSGNNGQFPFVITGKQGRLWSFQRTISKDQATSLSRINCNGLFCVAAGITHIKGTDKMEPYLVHSRDGGFSWSPPSTAVPIPVDLVSLEIQGVSCSSEACGVVGKYYTQNHSEKPFILMTQDFGKTWINPPILQDARFNTISSTGKHFMAAGQLRSDNRWAIAVSHDKGTTWSYQLSTTEPHKQEGMFDYLKCEKNYCTAAGYYENLWNTRHFKTPWVLVSWDYGNEWWILVNVQWELPKDFDNGKFFDASYAFKNDYKIPLKSVFLKKLNVTTT